MRPYGYTVVDTVAAATSHGGSAKEYLAGGTTLVDLMKLEVLTPEQVVDINGLPLTGITVGAAGLRIGALERMSDVAEHPSVRSDFSLVSQALELSASPQLRNMASMGGNLLQRTRCSYFRDISMPCNKRNPGTGCPAIDGYNRAHAVLGTSDACVATHASDVAVALVAAEASVELSSSDGERSVALEQFYRKPGMTPEVESELKPGELITAITAPRFPEGTRTGYLKVRDRQSYEFALTSVAVAITLRDNVITRARLAAGGVATVPWRLPEVENLLTNRPATAVTIDAAADAAAADARPLSHNSFKPHLLRRAIVRALTDVAGIA
ncbi:carbon-monoxide dehydrogenase medium subunit [Mycolicibacterium canariasense]|uniref:Carbon-monoxide dehydrogenase medium subunit n=1 Tax=Mycolicibacterium canariasense TaxID=228230 RepID=A0A124E387_MYCCR|nr:xanthine dehydrogenase family protein subunit M [Mycolicibacterium canariasense]MCV7208087.1 xanthine dehydrogenase family protein subunit M [Mycolicibacterium canariasense]ORV09563.1 FAD-binding molybdopterin dehydrogenase [Mycolicibacterium canariasense]GAS99169.1 carbon-monoxide dehydrogenase medium subunit [Mycolicibacterium canariasense]